MYPQFRLFIAGMMCAIALGVILFAGLAPFGHPPNNVVWLADQHGVRLGKHGTILSTGQLRGPANGVCSIELFVRPSRSNTDGTLLAFYASNGSRGLSVHQSLTALRLDDGAVPFAKKPFSEEVFRAGRLMFLTIVLGPRGTAVFLDGALVRQAPPQIFPLSTQACSGNFVVGDSPRNNNSWDGEFHGLAIYKREIASEQVGIAYQSWAKTGRPAENISGKPDALYLFDENGREIVGDHGTSGVSLYVPARYTIAQQTMLESPWSAFEPTWAYVKDILINIGGLMPFGFTLAAFLSMFLSARGRAKRVTAITVLAGFLVSLTIETLQAYLPTRDSDLTDVMTNTLGTWLGAMLYQAWLPRWLRIFSWMRIAEN